MATLIFTKTVYADRYQHTLSKLSLYIPRNAGILIAISDIFSFIIAFYLSLLIKNFSFYGSWISYPAVLDHKHVFFLIGVGVLFAFFGKGLYTRRVPWWTQVQYIIKMTFFAFLADGFLSFALKFDPSRLLTGLNWLLVCIFMIAARYTVYRLGKNSGLWRLPTIIVGDGNIATDALYAFNNDLCAPYETHSIILREKDISSFDIENLPKKYRTINIIDGYDNHRDFIKAHPHFFYIISPDTFRGNARDRLISLLNSEKIAYALIPSITNMNFYQMEPHYFFGQDVILLQSRTSVFSPSGLFIKRAIDIFGSAFALLLFAPLFLVTFVCLKLEGEGGSLLYGGQRVGKSGRTFRCWKFRTMAPNSDHLLEEYLETRPKARLKWEKYRKLSKDPRISTRTAGFIRKMSIDELPQLWNVLVGDMSLVGPRPILEDEIHYFGDRIDQYISVRPGITGLWQVSGRNATSFERRVHWDSWYVRNWSLWGDMVILIKTPFVLLSRSGAF